MKKIKTWFLRLVDKLFPPPWEEYPQLNDEEVKDFVDISSEANKF